MANTLLIDNKIPQLGELKLSEALLSSSPSVADRPWFPLPDFSAKVATNFPRSNLAVEVDSDRQETGGVIEINPTISYAFLSSGSDSLPQVEEIGTDSLQITSQGEKPAVQSVLPEVSVRILGISTFDFSNLVSGEEYAPDQVIVKLKTPTEPMSLMNALAVSGDVTVQERTKTLGIELWQLDGISVEEAIALYSQEPNIEYVEPNYLISVEQIPNDPYFSSLWGLHNTGQSGGTPDADIDAPEAWNIKTGNGNVIVGVIDTGVDYTHPDLINNIWTNSGETPNNGVDDDSNGYIDDFYGYDFAYEDSDPMDVYGHGTHVAGTISAEGNNGIGVVGVNWDAQIMPIKFLNDWGYGWTFDAIQAVEYATLMGANLTNNSWGGGGYDQGLSDAIAVAGDAGQLFIAAAGNYSNNNDLYPFYPASYNLDNIIAVASTDRYDNLSSFSNYGPTSVDLGAPGSAIYSTIPGGGYGYKSGTSMAAPHVSGVAALVWDQYPGLTAEEVKARILTTVDPIPGLDGKTVTGGRLNAYGAMIGPQPGEIYGSLWNDLDGNSQHNASEPGLPNWTVYLDQNGNSQLDLNETSTKTDINGNYSFTALTPGISYSVAEVIQPGWQQTYPGFNGGFETGNFPGWHTLGNNTIKTASYGSGPTEGTYQALMTNSSGSASQSQIETFLGLTPGSLDSLGNGNATEGSAIKQTFAVEAGTEVSFDWNFLTNNYWPYHDFAFVSIASTTEPDTTITLANVNDADVLSSTPFYEETGFGTFSYSFPTSGTYTLGVGVMDVIDTIVDSGLLVDNFIVSGDFRPTGVIQKVNLGSGQIVDDIDFGNQANIINGSNKKETIMGTVKNEILNGENGKDELYGMEGDDVLNGGNAQDILVGVNPDAVNPGRGEIDILNGGNGPDTFVLGNSVYYDDGDPNTQGLGDYALIGDFHEPDKIQLKGVSGDYNLVENFTVGSSTGTAIFLKDTIDELIGLVEGVTGLALNSNDFSFV